GGCAAWRRRGRGRGRVGVAADWSEDVKPDGFSAAFYAAPAGDSSRQPASGASPGTSSQPALAAAAGAFAAPAPARPRFLQAPADRSTRKGLRQQKALGFAGSLLIAGSFAVALSMWRPGQGKTRPRPTGPPAALAAERVERAEAPPAGGTETPLAPAASVPPGGTPDATFA